MKTNVNHGVNQKKKMQCKECGMESTARAIAVHIVKVHKLSKEEYYLKHCGIKGKCKICGADTPFKNIVEGYQEYCSAKCSMQGRWQDKSYRELKQRQNKETAIENSEKSKIRMENLWKSKGNELSEKIHEARSTTESRQKSSELTKAQWQNTDLKMHVQASLAERWKDPEYRKFMKAVNDSRIDEMSERSKAMWNDPEYREFMHGVMKTLWEDPEYRSKMESILEDNKSKVSKAVAEKWKDEEYRERMIANLHARMETDKYKLFMEENREKAKAVMIELWKDPEYRKKMASCNKSIKILYNNERLRFDSSYELSFWLYCITNGIPITRNTKETAYMYKGKTHYVTHDFNIIKDDSLVKIEIKGPHIDGLCVYGTFDDEHYAAKKEALKNTGVIFITKTGIEDLGFPTERSKVIEIAQSLGLTIEE